MDLLSSPPHGRYYMPSSPPPEPSGMECWEEGTWEKFEDERCKISKCILSATRRFYYKNFLRRQDVRPDGFPRQKWASLKSYCLNNFELQDNQVYRQAEEHKGVSYKARYVACYSDSFDMICRIHRGIGHARKFILN
jgi:hypothetical protein